MTSFTERTLVGPAALVAVTELLQRTRRQHPTHGLFEAADLQWWSRRPRSTDEIPQLVWFDADGRPEAAAVLTDWGDATALDVLTLPDASRAEHLARVDVALRHAATHGITRVEFEVDDADGDLVASLAERGFEAAGNGTVEGWVDAAARPGVSPIAPGYRLVARSDLPSSTPHHLERRNGADVAARLAATSLHRQDLDLVVLTDDDVVAAYGLFWMDPVSQTGLVEPMRTEEEHQRRGLARHVLTAGIERLAVAGAHRIKISWEMDNPAAADLYRSVGFVPVRRTILLAGPTDPPTRVA